MGELSGQAREATGRDDVWPHRPRSTFREVPRGRLHESVICIHCMAPWPCPTARLGSGGGVPDGEGDA